MSLIGAPDYGWREALMAGAALAYSNRETVQRYAEQAAALRPSGAYSAFPTGSARPIPTGSAPKSIKRPRADSGYGGEKRVKLNKPRRKKNIKRMARKKNSKRIKRNGKRKSRKSNRRTRNKTC